MDRKLREELGYAACETLLLYSTVLITSFQYVITTFCFVRVFVGADHFSLLFFVLLRAVSRFCCLMLHRGVSFYAVALALIGR